jgi:hypothetical protein
MLAFVDIEKHSSLQRNRGRNGSLIVSIVETEEATQKGINMFYDPLGILYGGAFRARIYLFRAHGGCGQLSLPVFTASLA